MKSQMDRLEWWLKKQQIGYERIKEEKNVFGIDRNQIYIETNLEKFSIICHFGSYGYEQGLLEFWDFGNEDPIGYLTAEQVKRILKRRLVL